MTQTQIDGAKQIRNGTIGDAQIASGAAIALTKLAEPVLQADGGQTFTGNQNAGGFKITNALDGSADSDYATVGQARQFANGKDWKDGVCAASLVNGTLASAYENGDTIDGVVLATGDRILLKNQTSGLENGLYIVNASGAPTRAPDADVSSEVTNGLTVVVTAGTQAGTVWTLTTPDPIVLNTTALTFTQTGATGGGTVTSVSVVSANGFAGSVATATSTPAITITTTITGMIKGNGTAISAAVAGVDYLAPSSQVTRETPSGTVNGSNTAFILSNTPLVGTEQVYLNGLQQEPGAGADYTISGATITYLTAPIVGDKIRVTYLK